MPGDQMVETSRQPTEKRSGWSTDPRGPIAGEEWHRVCQCAIDEGARANDNNGEGEEVPLLTTTTTTALSTSARWRAQICDLAFESSNFSAMHLPSKTFEIDSPVFAT